jgi:hypothetical protein
MKAKLTLLLTSVLLVVLAVATTPKPAEASCSGDDCGCYTDTQQCEDDCRLLYPGQPGPCERACIRESKSCAIQCCGGYQF